MTSQSDNMESEIAADVYEDNRDAYLSRQSLQSAKANSRPASFRKHKKKFRENNQDEGEKDTCVESRSKTRTWNSDPDRDHVSDGEGRRSGGSFYSEDYENESPGRSLSPYSHSQTPSPTPQREIQAKRISSSPLYKTSMCSTDVIDYKADKCRKCNP